ncbi:glycosyl transferase, group 1 [Olavius algarvensis associated proteobacterium Delta 3]|nr:glycosyl transferase, group 1 [Olavius algarvensis associated proteobacterium Delta 3]CAB5171229.1 glycosyl transferase, group 1 [Olavius algarvensis associated proteobacterium Delta 3]
MSLNVGFVSTRFSGIDGVSLEAAKWSEVIDTMGHQSYWFAGESDRTPDRSFVEPKAHFKTALNHRINRCITLDREPDFDAPATIQQQKAELETALLAFLETYNINFLIVENAISIPMQVPLGLAVRNVLSKLRIPTIAHHHDFYWERGRFQFNGYQKMIQRTFPPNLPNVRHVVINSIAQRQLFERTGITSQIIPNVMDYSNPPAIEGDRVSRLRTTIGVDPDDIMILQPTRMIARKGIENTLEIVRRLNDARCKLIVSHKVDDEGWDYYRRITATCEKLGIDIRFIYGIVANPILNNFDPEAQYSLWEVYKAADLITFPSLNEGFGNAFLEAIFVEKPIVMNRYETFVADIESKGFDVIKFDGRINSNTMDQVRTILSNKSRQQQMVETNYGLAKLNFSYDLLRKQLSGLIPST